MKFTILTLIILAFICLCRSGKYEKEAKQFHLEKEYQDFLEEYKEFKSRDPRYQNSSFLQVSQNRYISKKEEIAAHHASYELGLVKYDRKLMRWSDLSKNEKFKLLCGAKLPRRARAATNAAYLRILKAMPKVPNGTQVNHCHFPNPIYDQMACGCCWAFSCCQVLEHQMFVKKNIRTQLSVQQLVDCDSSNDACEGGWPTNGFRYVQIFGLASGLDYKYENMKQAVCKRSQHRRLLLPQYAARQLEVEMRGDEESMKKLIKIIGAAVVAVHADEEFLTITKGFYENDSCPKTEPNHAMVVCGFGSDENGEYWLIRNSWGSGWGEYGYTKMKMGNTCGVASFVMWPVIVGEPSLNPFTGEVAEKLYEHHEEDEWNKF